LAELPGRHEQGSGDMWFPSPTSHITEAEKKRFFTNAPDCRYLIMLSAIGKEKLTKYYEFSHN
jgi:hypothetical protein